MNWLKRYWPHFIVSTAAAFLVGFIFLLATVTTGSSAKDLAYNTIKPQIQNAVTVYMNNHDGELPPHQGLYDISTEWGGNITCDVINICSLIGDIYFLRDVPDGCYGEKGEAGTNFYSGECDNPEDGDYVWLMDDAGNAYSTCIGDKCDANNEDGYQCVWCGIRHCESPGLLSDYWIVITVGLLLLLLYISAIVSITLRTRHKRRLQN